MILTLPMSALAAARLPDLGTAGSFGVLAGSTVTNTGATTVDGNVGVSPGSSVTGFPPGIVNGEIHAADAVALQAHNDANTAYGSASKQTCDFNLTGQDLGGMTLVPGVYCFDNSAQLTGQLTLNGLGNPNSIFIFKIGSTLTTANNSGVSMSSSAQACDVFWKVGSSATLGTNTHFAGNIVALTSITLNTGASSSTGLYALNGAVTLDTNSIQACGFAPAPTVTPTPGAVDTATSTVTSTSTPVPATNTPVSTATAVPTNTTVRATATTQASATNTSTDIPVNTRISTVTQVSTRIEQATNTTLPTDTPTEVATNTAVTIETATAPVQATDTPVQTALSTETSISIASETTTPTATTTSTSMTPTTEIATNTVTVTVTVTITTTATSTLATPGTTPSVTMVTVRPTPKLPHTGGGEPQTAWLAIVLGVILLLLGFAIRMLYQKPRKSNSR